jgi:hypothetical protein
MVRRTRAIQGNEGTVCRAMAAVFVLSRVLPAGESSPGCAKHAPFSDSGICRLNRGRHSGAGNLSRSMRVRGAAPGLGQSSKEAGVSARGEITGQVQYVLPSTLTEAPAYPKCGISRPGDVAPSRCTWVGGQRRREVAGCGRSVRCVRGLKHDTQTAHRLETKQNRWVIWRVFRECWG